MRENRPYGSEGGEGITLPEPYQTPRDEKTLRHAKRWIKLDRCDLKSLRFSIVSWSPPRRVDGPDKPGHDAR
jgi:hypothetical protein